MKLDRPKRKEIEVKLESRDIKAMLGSREIMAMLDQQEYSERKVMLAHVDLLAREGNKVYKDLSVRYDLNVYKVFKKLKAIVVNEVNVA